MLIAHFWNCCNCSVKRNATSHGLNPIICNVSAASCDERAGLHCRSIGSDIIVHKHCGTWQLEYLSAKNALHF